MPDATQGGGCGPKGELRSVSVICLYVIFYRLIYYKPFIILYSIISSVFQPITISAHPAGIGYRQFTNPAFHGIDRVWAKIKRADLAFFTTLKPGLKRESLWRGPKASGEGRYHVCPDKRRDSGREGGCDWRNPRGRLWISGGAVIRASDFFIATFISIYLL